LSRCWLNWLAIDLKLKSAIESLKLMQTIPFTRALGYGLAAILLCGCVSSRPNNLDNICSIFDDRRAWYKAAKSAHERWGSSVAVNMAIIYQESSFKARAKPPRNKFLWVFPGGRPSSAFGYAQALDSTWEDYERRSGNGRASRSNFSDAVDFVAWYNANSTRISGISKTDARGLYLAYHEGNGGYQRGTYREKQWLLDAAARVQSNSDRFAVQLDGCRSQLNKNWFQRLFF
jgi:hypothetical protein